MQNNQAGQILDVFSIQEIQTLDDALIKLADAPNHGQDFYAYTNGFRAGNLIYPFINKMVINKIQKVLNQAIKLTTGMHLKEQSPWPIHTDYVKGDQNPNMAILIPLNIQLIPTHTVIFNECCQDSFDNYRRDHSKIKNNSVELHKDIMSHENIDYLEYVSTHGIYKWIPGSVIYWDRKLLHSSDNFLLNGLTEKTALVLFTNND
jgi:hypothetical protein